MNNFLKTEPEIKDWLYCYGIKKYDLYWGIENDELIWCVDVTCGVNLKGKGLTSIPINFRYVFNGFDCSFNSLTSLEGGPLRVSGDFLCNNNQLLDLKHSPKSVRGDFLCYSNKLSTIEFLPELVDGVFLCDNNPGIGFLQKEMEFKKIQEESLRIKKNNQLKEKLEKNIIKSNPKSHKTKI